MEKSNIAQELLSLSKQLDDDKQISQTPDNQSSSSPDQQKPSTEKTMSDKAQMLFLAIKAMSAMKMTKDDNIPSEIIQGLYLGSIGAAFNKESLKSHGITHILTCADKIKPRFPEEFQYMTLPILDTPNENIAKYFKQANEFIRVALEGEDVENQTVSNNKVLVHCFAGKSRSTSFILAYLMSRKGMNLRDGIDLVRSKRPIAEPNPGFVLQLKAFENLIFGKMSNVPLFLSKETNKDQKKENEQEKIEEKMDESNSHSKEEEGISTLKEVSDSLQQIKLSGDKEGAEELEEKIIELENSQN